MPDNTRTRKGKVVWKGPVEVELEARVSHHRKLRELSRRGSIAPNQQSSIYGRECYAPAEVKVQGGSME